MMNTSRRFVPCASVALLVFALTCNASAQARDRRLRAIPNGAAGAGMVTLPYSATDQANNQWFIYPGGWLQQRGNAPLYSQGASLQINGNGVQSQSNQARMDEKTGELIFDNMNAGGTVTVTRRVLINVNDGYVRYIDILKNAQAAEQRVNVLLQTNSNYGVASSQNINEPGGKQRPIGWTAQTPAGRAIVELYSGRGTKFPPTIAFQPGNSFVQTSWQVTLPPNKEVALMHVHSSAATPEAGAAAMLALRESDLYKNVPADVRRLVVNFAPAASFIGDRELLRGDLLDVVELRGNGGGGGDQLKGTIKDTTFKLTTFYGTIDLAADKVISMFNVGQFRPRQLIVTSDGEIFGGKTAKETIDLELSSGQVTQVPLSQIARIGWRRQPNEQEGRDVFDPANDKPFVLLRSGDKIAIERPTKPIEVNTRYGLLKIDPTALAAISFAAEDTGVHRIQLTDGSHFAGLVVGEQFNFKLAGGAGGQDVSFPASSLARLQLAVAPEGPEDSSAATLKLANEDLLVGALVGQLKLDTAFDTITLNAPEIRALSRSSNGDAAAKEGSVEADAAGGFDVQIELWDQTRMSGQLQETQVVCALTSGVQVRVPVPLVGQYTQPLPMPSAAMTDRIGKLVAELGAEDWKQRERAEQTLVEIGSPVVRVLRAARPTASAEAQQRIDSIIGQIEKHETKPATPAVAPPNGD